MRCGNIVIGKIPETVPEWMMDANGETLPNGLWVNDINQIPDVLASAVNGWIEDDISPTLYDEIEKTNKEYSLGQWEVNVDEIITDIFNKRVTEFETLKNNKNLNGE